MPIAGHPAVTPAQKSIYDLLEPLGWAEVHLFGMGSRGLLSVDMILRGEDGPADAAGIRAHLLARAELALVAFADAGHEVYASEVTLTSKKLIEGRLRVEISGR